MVGSVHLAAWGGTKALLPCRAGRCGQLRRFLKGLCCALCGLAAHAHGVRCVCLQRRPHKWRHDQSKDLAVHKQKSKYCRASAIRQ